MKIYISGPISGRDPDKVRTAFETAEKEIREKGHEPVNPYKLQTILDPATTDWAQYMHVALALVKVCDAIYMLPGWKKSAGAGYEHILAEDEHKHIFYSMRAIWKPAQPGETEEGTNE